MELTLLKFFSILDNASTIILSTINLVLFVIALNNNHIN